MFMFLRYMLIFGVLVFFINSFHLLPSGGFSFIYSSDAGHAAIHNVDRGLHYFNALLEFQNMLFFLVNQPLYAYNNTTMKLMADYGLNKYMMLSFIYPLVISVFLLFFYKHQKRTEKIIFLLILSFFVILLLCVSPHAYTLGTEFFRGCLKYIPGFGMFRDLSGKLTFVYFFFFALILGVSLSGLAMHTPKIISIAFFSILLFIILFNGRPLITGNIFYTPWNQSNNIKGSIDISEEYKTFAEWNKNIKLDAKYLGAPLGDTVNERLKGKHGGMYIGPEIIGSLTGKRCFMGLAAFREFGPLFTRIGRGKKHHWFRAFMPIFNIKYVFYNSDDYILDNFNSWPYSQLKKSYPDQLAVKEFISDIRFNKEIFHMEKFILNTTNCSHDFLPHFYTCGEWLTVPLMP